MVPGGHVPDEVHDRGVGAARVVQVREGVREPRAEVEDGARGFTRHPGVAVRGAAHDGLVQPEDGSHRVCSEGIERADEPHLGRPGVGEAHLNAALMKRVNEGLGARLWRGARGEGGAASRSHGVVSHPSRRKHGSLIKRPRKTRARESESPVSRRRL